MNIYYNLNYKIEFIKIINCKNIIKFNINNLLYIKRFIFHFNQ